jgi:hypothetical protein
MKTTKKPVWVVSQENPISVDRCHLLEVGDLVRISGRLTFLVDQFLMRRNLQLRQVCRGKYEVIVELPIRETPNILSDFDQAMRLAQ